MGTLLRDYHTTQVPSAKRGLAHYTRRSELAVDDLNTILSSRDYRCDAAYTVAIEIHNSATYTAQEMANALAKPAFTLYLGRKSVHWRCRFNRVSSLRQRSRTHWQWCPLTTTN